MKQYFFEDMNGKRTPINAQRAEEFTFMGYVHRIIDTPAMCVLRSTAKGCVPKVQQKVEHLRYGGSPRMKNPFDYATG